MWGGGEKVFSLKLKYAHPSLSIASQDIVYFLYYSRSVYEIFKRILEKLSINVKKTNLVVQQSCFNFPEQKKGGGGRGEADKN